MKKILPFLLICLTLFTKAQIVSIDEPNTYIPSELTGAKLGIGIAEFQTLNDTAKMARNSQNGYSYIQFKQSKPSANILSATYKFDTPQRGVNTNRPMYEIGIEFVDADAAEKFVTSTFTSQYRISAAAEKEWFLSTSKDYWILIRKTGNMVTIAAMMNGTEWGFE